LKTNILKSLKADYLKFLVVLAFILCGLNVIKVLIRSLTKPVRGIEFSTSPKFRVKGKTGIRASNEWVDTIVRRVQRSNGYSG
jgi:hypothetical protein